MEDGADEVNEKVDVALVVMVIIPLIGALGLIPETLGRWLADDTGLLLPEALASLISNSSLILPESPNTCRTVSIAQTFQ